MAERNFRLTRPVRLRLFVAGSFLWLAGCAGYSTQIRSVEAELAAQRPDAALQVLEKQHHSNNDRVLYLLNKGILLRMGGHLEQSNEALEAAKQRMKRLYAISLREQTASFVINDTTRSYVGEEYEQILLYVYKALNYLELGNTDDARVEVLQMDVRLTELGKTVGEVEAFGRYVAGMVFETRREWNDAMVAYRRAYGAYRRAHNGTGGIPRSLQYALLRIAQRQGLNDEVAKYREEFGIDHWSGVSERSAQGELVLVFHNGLAPKKRERSLMMRDRQSEHIVRISVPYYPVTHVPVADIQVSVAGRSVIAEQVEDTNFAARRTLEIKKGAITARAIARAAVKARIASEAREQSRKNHRPLLGLLAEVATIVSERADTRSWTTLPYNMYMARIPLAPGTYDVQADVQVGLGRVQHSRSFNNVVLGRGESRVISYHWVTPGIYRRR